MCINKANDEGVYTKRCRRHFLYLSFTSVSNYSLAVIRNKYHTHFLGSVHKDAARPLRTFFYLKAERIFFYFFSDDRFSVSGNVLAVYPSNSSITYFSRMLNGAGPTFSTAS